jgi:hypothetical protein
MKAVRKTRRRRNEAGIALLIAIFVLLLIGVVAIALIVSSGTESALAGNYRSSTSVYYAALAGLEEVRARLRPNDSNSFKNTWAAFYAPPGTTLPIGTVGYVLNPGPNDTLGNMLTTYPDQEYDTEFGPGALGSATVSTTSSVWNRAPLNGLPFPGPLYKWVRINAVSEKSMNLDVDADGLPDSVTPLFYDNVNRVFSNNSNVGPQALELTALAYLPNGSQKLLQYIAASAPIAPSSFQPGNPLFLFKAALTLSGSDGGGSPTFQAPANNAVFAVKGGDHDCSGNPAAGQVAAIGLFGDYSGGSPNSDLNSIVNGIPTSAGGPPPTNPQLNYTGNTPPHALPDVEYLSAFPANMQSPSQVDAFAQNIIQNAVASLVPAGSAGTQQAFLNSLGMSPTNPVTVIANGDLNLTNWTGTGYGLLLVTGTLIYDPSTTWNGAVLVIGQGQVINIDHGQYQQINGAVFVAKTRDAGGSLLAGFGGGSVSFDPPMQGNGIYYSSCWIQKSMPTSGYRILSFHEISQ